MHNLFRPRRRSVSFLVYLRAKDKIMIWTFESLVSKPKENLFNKPFVACSFILLPSELFQLGIGGKIVNISMKFKFFHKIVIIHEKFLVLFNLLPDVTHSGSGARAAGCASLLYMKDYM